MRDLHPAGGGPSKRKSAWEYEGPHGSGKVQVKRKPDSNLDSSSELTAHDQGQDQLQGNPEDWPSIEFIAPAAA